MMDKMQREFPEYVKVESIGKSFEGRDINMLQITAPSVAKGENAPSKPAIFMTGATHARELISTSLNMYKAIKLL